MEKKNHYLSVKLYSEIKILLLLLRISLGFILKVKCFLKTRIHVEKTKNYKINAFAI